MITAAFVQIATYFFCFFLVWLGAGLVVKSVSELTHSWRLPSFLISFVILGFLTSLPELTVGLVAVHADTPQIFAGNLLGGAVMILLFIVPLLAIFSKGLAVPAHIQKTKLPLTLLLVFSPVLALFDQKIDLWEASVLVVLYLVLLIFLAHKNTSFVRSSPLSTAQRRWQVSAMTIIVGVVLLIGASEQIIDSTVYFADILHIPRFIVSLFLVALGTNIPEIAIGVQSVLLKKKEVALANYLGSASANIFFLGALTLLHGKSVVLGGHALQRLLFVAIGLALFFVFARSKSKLTAREGFILLGLYVCFVIFELVFLPSLS